LDPDSPDPPGYSDPIVIPITLTIADPRPQNRGGRRRRSQHPSFTDPTWFKRSAYAPGLTFAQYMRPLPLNVPVPMPSWPLDEAHRLELAGMMERARRRAREAAEEIERGEYGAAGGHLLLGQPYPAEVDDPAPIILRNETQGPAGKKPYQGDIEIDQEIDKAEKDFEARRAHALDERHLQDAEGDRRGEPIIKKTGKPYDHENEVAEGRKGLGNQVKA
jgi:hypothetical protein